MNGLKIIVTASWVSGWRWEFLRPGKTPSKSAGRKGTRRDWKRRHPRGLRWRYGAVEPDHMLRTGDKIICTPHQAAALRAATTPPQQEGAEP